MHLFMYYIKLIILLIHVYGSHHLEININFMSSHKFRTTTTFIRIIFCDVCTKNYASPSEVTATIFNTV